MKTKEEIMRKVEQLKQDNLLNEDRKEHYKNYSERYAEYERMVEANNNKLDMLYWVLNQE